MGPLSTPATAANSTGEAPRAVPAGLIGLLLGCWACTPAGTPAPASLAHLEQSFLSWRHDTDRVQLLKALDAAATPDGLSAASAQRRERASRALFARRLATVGAPQSPEDSSALEVMREVWEAERDPPEELSDAAPGCAVTGSKPIVRSAPDLARLSAQTMACFQRAANRIVVDGDTLNRLAILGMMPRIADRDRRQRLFLALGPVWHSINGANTPDSPYRTLLGAYSTAWGDSLSPVEGKAPAFGVSNAQFEEWLEDALARYRRLLPDTLVEPWDWYYLAGEASRRLSARLPDLASLERVNEAYFTSIGASPAALNIHYDLVPRPGKYPVAYTSFGGRQPVEPWVFTSYLIGGFDNLSELLHETGHAIHIAGVRTRPAFLDWPDNDTYTEALADVPALELYEPRWQQQFLADSVPLAAALRAKYATIAFDMAWSLFELRAYRTPAIDPNQLWSDLAERHLGIRRHPEWSWWAMRGQLIDSPGYLLNYALGAFIAADIRSRLTARGSGFGGAHPQLYQELTASLYQHGRSQASRQVLERFLGRPISAEALLSDLGRMAP